MSLEKIYTIVGSIAVGSILLFFLAIVALIAYVIFAFLNAGGLSHDPDGEHLPTTDTLYLYPRTFRFELDWTPHGDHLVFVPKVKHNIYSVEADGSNFRRLFNEKKEYHYNAYPDISPGGHRIVFSTMRYPVEERHGVRNFDIERSDLYGGERKRLTQDETGNEIYPAWSPDGSRRAFTKVSGLPRGIYTISQDGTDEREVVAFNTDREARRATGLGVGTFFLYGPFWQPQGNMLAFVVRENEQGVQKDVIYSVGIDGSGLTRVFSTEPYDQGGMFIGGAPAWSPDGERIAFILGGYSRSRGVGEAVMGLYTVRSDGIDLRRVADPHDALRNQYFVSPGGTETFDWDSSSNIQYFVSRRTNLEWHPIGGILFVAYNFVSQSLLMRDVLVYNPEDGTVRKVAEGSQAFWSPDGSKIAVIAYPEKEIGFDPIVTGKPLLFTIPFNSPGEKQVLAILGEDYKPATAKQE